MWCRDVSKDSAKPVGQISLAYGDMPMPQHGLPGGAYRIPEILRLLAQGQSCAITGQSQPDMMVSG